MPGLPEGQQTSRALPIACLLGLADSLLRCHSPSSLPRLGVKSKRAALQGGQQVGAFTVGGLWRAGERGPTTPGAGKSALVCLPSSDVQCAKPKQRQRGSPPTARSAPPACSAGTRVQPPRSRRGTCSHRVEWAWARLWSSWERIEGCRFAPLPAGHSRSLQGHNPLPAAAIRLVRCCLHAAQHGAQPGDTNLLQEAASSTSPGAGAWHAPCSRCSSSIASACSEAAASSSGLAASCLQPPWQQP